MEVLKDIQTHRYILFYRVPSRKKGRDDLIQAHFDGSKSPDKICSPEEFIQFIEKHHGDSYSDIFHQRLLKAITIYELKFLVDTADFSITTLEEVVEKPPTIQDTLQEGLKTFHNKRSNKPKKDPWNTLYTHSNQLTTLFFNPSRK